MKRAKKILECKRHLEEESVDHLHIRRKAIVTDFTTDLRSELDEYRIVSVDISEWEYSELMETLRHELQKELSLPKYYFSRIVSGTASLLGVGGGVGIEAHPDYSRTTDYLKNVSEKSGRNIAIFINYHGSNQIGEFGWIPKLDIPETATIVTTGYRKCGLRDSTQVDVGRLDVEQTVEYLTDQHPDLSEEEAMKIHHIHDGNPVAIQIATERGSLREPLTGDALRELWERVYDDKISGAELDLLTDSSHLIDLDQRDVASVTNKTRGEAKELLRQLEDKGVVSQEQSGLFTTDHYVKRYTSAQLTGEKLSEQHRMSFHDYVEKWVDSYESRMQEIQKTGDSEETAGSISPPDFDVGLTDPDLFLAIHHLSEIHDQMGRETFVEELADVDADTAGMFTFGLIAQRFFFENPKVVMQDLSEHLLGIEEDIGNELFSGTLSIFFGFDIQEFMSILAEGWSGDISTEPLKTRNVSNPGEAVKRIQQGIDAELYRNLPKEVKLAIARIIAMAIVDTRTAREYYNMFGKTAQNYGLDEDAFCSWLEEVEDLVDELNPETEDSESEGSDPHEESLEALNSVIRDRTDLRKLLEENQSQAQREFQQRMEKIRNKPDEVAEQYIQCGEQLAKTENNIFPFIWYSFGHKIFTKIVLGEQNWKIYGEYKQWSGAREEQERNLGENVTVPKNEIESMFD